ncbi:MAG TPA: hypothetical protein VFK10_06410 [Burkholderiaceae bacterium]|nr:hypothetical protein [Burkholderiaceae bacterium]
MRHIGRGITLAALTLSAVAFAHPDSRTLVKFEGAIGVDPLTAAGVSPGSVDVVNVVRGIQPGGRAWVIRALHAAVGKNGHIFARGSGLLLASGDVIGTVGPVTQVGATLACGPAAPTATLFNSAPAALDAAGNFRIDSALTQDGVNPAVLPTTCDNPALLIRAVGANGAFGPWFAAGIPDVDDND